MGITEAYVPSLIIPDRSSNLVKFPISNMQSHRHQSIDQEKFVSFYKVKALLQPMHPIQ